MDCNDFAPFFLLYNGGKLNAFGFAEQGFVESPRVEHPKEPFIGVCYIKFSLFFEYKLKVCESC